MKYTNKQLLNDGLRIKGQVPADDRTVLGAVSELFVSPSNRGDDTLFNRAYVGLKVTIEGDDFASYVCVDAGPYTPGSTAEVKNSNWKNYWHKADKDIFDYVYTTVDTSIRDLSTFVRNTVNTSVNLIETYVRTNNLPDANNNGLTITPTLGVTGNSYAIKVNTDSSTVAIVNDKLVGGTYRVVKDEANDLDDTNLFARYYLVYRKPGSSTDVSIGNSATIEIPKVQILKDAYICKAVEDPTKPGGYRVTSRQGDPSWDTDTNEVFICIEWDIQNGNSADLIGNSDGVTYIGISDIFSNNFEIINASINYLESSVGDISTKFRRADASIFSGLTSSINTLRTNVNSSLSDLSTNLNGKISTLTSYVNTSISDLSSNVNTKINNLSTNVNDKINDLSTYVNTNINDKINNLSTNVNDKINDLSTYVNTNINDKINDLSTNVNDNINDLSTYVNTNINDKINDLSINVNAKIQTINSNISSLNTGLSQTNAKVGTLDASVKNMDTSVKFMYETWKDDVATWANAWNQLFIQNPGLVKPDSSDFL
jgi:phage host-nuclease inhibitor protein Gam